eukprot:767769-Hanusia_phi.AAC.4
MIYSIRIWCLDPVNGAWPVMGENFTAHSHIRDYTCLAFSQDRNHLFAGSTTGGGAKETSSLLVGGGDGTLTRIVRQQKKSRMCH